MTAATRPGIATVGLSVLALFALPSEGAASAFRGLIGSPGVLPEGVEAYALSQDGRVVVGQLRMPGGLRWEAFRWSAESGFEPLGSLGGATGESVGLGVSADGSVVVGTSDSPGSGVYGEAFRWEQATGMVGLGVLPGGDFESTATAVSADGEVVVGRSNSTLAPNGFGEAFRWTAATGMVGLGVQTPGGPTFANGLSADGSVIAGTASTPQGHEIFRWTEAGGMELLGDLAGSPSPASWGLDSSADGSVLVGWTDDSEPKALRWTAASGLVDLAGPGTQGNRVWKVSPDGSVAGGDAFVSGPSSRIATIWDQAHGLRELRQALVESGLALEIEGWSLEYVAGIASDNLTIVGSGINPAGQYDAFVAELGAPSIVQIPTLSTGPLVAFAVLLAVAAVGALRLR
jgi:probable HAF family extracellular repeat protein